MPMNSELKPKIRFKGFTDDWEQRKAKELCSITTGKSNTQDQVQDGKYPFYIRSDVPVRSNRYLYDEEAVITIGDGNIGRVFHYVNGKFDLHQRCYKMADFKALTAKYFYYYFSTKFYERAMSMTAKATVDSVRLEMISDMEIKFPKDTTEQTIISELLTNLDNLITLHQRKCDKLVELKKSLLEKMFPQNNSVIPEIRFKGFTNDWEQRKLKELCNIFDGTHQTPNYTDSGIMFLSVENIKDLKSEKYISYDDFKNNFRIYPEKNDILMTRIGDIGTTNIVKGSTLKAYYVSLALLKCKNINPYYLNFAIKSDFVQNGLKLRSLLTAIPMKINKDQIGEVDINYPINLEEQSNIGKIFDNIDNLITLHQCKYDKLNKIRQSLLNDMFI
jgi:type I restriction enzyme S subunit